MLNGATTRKTWRAWLLLAVACWACAVPAWAFAPGASVREAKTRVGVFCASYDESCPAQPRQVAETHQEKCAARYDSASGPTVGLYYLRARYLNTDSGRFWSMDVDEGNTRAPMTLAKYIYGIGNPNSFVDPSGNSIMDYMGLGRPVHRYLENLYVSGNSALRFKELYLSTIANRANAIKSRNVGQLRRIFGSSLGGRVDMGSFEGNGDEVTPFVLFEIKSYLELAEGMAQLEQYILALHLAAPDVTFAPGMAENWPAQPSLITVNGYKVFVFRPVFGVIAYVSPEQEAHSIAAAVTIYGLFKILRQLTALNNAKAVGELEGQIAFSITAKGML